MGYFKVSLFKEALQYFPEWQYHWTLARSKHWGSDFFTFYPMFVISCLLVFFFNSHVNRCEGISHNRLDLHLLGTTDFEHLFMCLLPICISLWRNISSNSLTIVFFF